MAFALDLFLPFSFLARFASSFARFASSFAFFLASYHPIVSGVQRGEGWVGERDGRVRGGRVGGWE